VSATNIRERAVAAACEALGVPERAWPLFTRWAAEPMTQALYDQITSYVDVLIADRCVHPRGDLLTQLIELEVAGQALTTEEIHAFVIDFIRAAD